jgi:hypothetical protein
MTKQITIGGTGDAPATLLAVLDDLNAIAAEVLPGQ